MNSTIGQLLIDEALPEDMRGQPRILDGKGLKTLFQEIAEKHPDNYRDIAQRLIEVSADAMYTSGGYSGGLKDLLPTQSYLKTRQNLQNQIQLIASDSRLSDKEREAKIIKTVSDQSENIEKSIYDESLKEKNPFALQVSSGSKGKPGNLRSLRGGDLLYVNHRNVQMPIPVLHSYAEGLTPAEYWAGSYGARKGIVDLKLATQNAGAFSKVLSRGSHRLVITAKDSNKPHDAESPRGFPVNVSDPDNEGALLAQDIPPYKRNTVLTPKILASLKELGKDEILVRSPTVGGPEDGGVYANDVGIRERNGQISPVGDFVGIAAAQAIGEPMQQAQIGSKHTGGVAGAGSSVSGFKAINQLTSVPKVYTGGSVHSQTDGRVESIEDAPAGGKNVHISGEKHYIGVDNILKVKKGDVVEAGDQLTDGLPNPSELVKFKGVGEGRRAFVDAFKQTAKDAGFNLHRRNIELVARGLINHVKLSENMGDFLADDIIPYNALEHTYEPREGHKITNPKTAIGNYLESPVLHYSIGTHVTPKVAERLDKFGVKRVISHPDPAPFEPEMIRGESNLLYDSDWMTKMLGSNLEKGLLKSVHRGGISDEGGTSYVPSLARGVDFGKNAPIKGFDPADLINQMSTNAPTISKPPVSNTTSVLQPSSTGSKKYSIWG